MRRARDLAITTIIAAQRGENRRVAIERRRQPAGLTFAQVWAAYQEAGYQRRGLAPQGLNGRSPLWAVVRGGASKNRMRMVQGLIAWARKS